MSLKESNEITVKIKGKLEDFYKIIEEKGVDDGKYNPVTGVFLYCIYLCQKYRYLGIATTRMVSMS